LVCDWIIGSLWGSGINNSMKDMLLEIIKNDTSKNKSATRYLYKTHPILWQQILDATNFLPDSVVAKQRVWHIINEIYTRPTCPQTGEYVKWNENKYLTFISSSAKATYQNKLGMYNNHNNRTNTKRSKSVKQNYVDNPDVFQKKIDTWMAKYGTDNPFKHPLIKEKAKITNLEKYGVENNFQRSDIIEQNYQTGVDLGRITPREQRSDKRRYYDSVAFYTAESWKCYFDKINPNRLDRSNGWELDHIYSQLQGFRDNIPAYIIGHWTNLQMLSKGNNSSKRDNCHKTQEKLFEDFFNSVYN